MYLHVWFQLNIIMFSSFVHHFVFFCSSQLSRISPAGRVCTYFPFPGPHGSHSRKNAGGTLVAAWERDSYTGLWDMYCLGKIFTVVTLHLLQNIYFRIFHTEWQTLVLESSKHPNSCEFRYSAN